MIDARAGDERERHSVHVGILGLESPLGVRGVAHPPEGPADYLRRLRELGVYDRLAQRTMWITYDIKLG